MAIISNLFQPNYQPDFSFSLVSPKTRTTTNASSTGPVSLSYASYYGQSINNLFHDVVLDAAGNIYATGSTINQGYDVVVAKFDPAGALIWERFIGGSDSENFNPSDTYDYGKIAIDPSGNVYVTGITASADFPTVNAFQTTLGGSIDAFLVKLDNDGNITNSSFLGGNGVENIGGSGGIAVDDNGNIYLAGSTTSEGFFDTSNAYQSNFSGGTKADIFITRITADFSTVTGTYWGDEALDVVKDMQLATNGNLWLVGQSTESELALSGYQPAAIEAQDGLVIAFNNTLSQVTEGTFFGGKFDEEINALAIDPDGNILIAGSTFSTNDFPTLSAFQGNYSGGQEAFAAKLSPNCQLIWSTFIGGGQNESGTSIAVDANGNVVVGGMTSSADFAVHRTAQETYNKLNCEHDAFLFKFNSDGTQDWATYYGGWRAEQAYGLAINANNQVICVGLSESTDLPVTSNADQPTAFTSGINAFISIFEVACPARPIIIASTENAVYYDKFWCNNYESSYTQFFSNDSCALQLIAPPGYTTYSWERNGTLINGANTQYYTVPNPGSENNAANVTYQAIIEDGNDCLSPSSSTEGKINWKRPMCGFGGFDENELPHLSAINEGNSDVVFCAGESISIPLSADGFCGATFQWQKDRTDIPGATAANYTVTEAGCYRIAISNSFTGCTVYSITKRFIPLTQVILNDYYLNRPESCEVQDSITGCSSVFIRARIPSCDACDRSPNQGVSYSFFLDGVLQSSNTYGYISTSQEGNYTVEVTNGSCIISSNTLTVSIRPTEPPIWLAPTVTPICIQSNDSVTFVVSHPAIGDSAILRFDLPSPSTDVITLDSFVTIAKSDMSGGCMDVWLTTKEGCSSRTADIKLHDTITPIIRINGPPCIPVRLRTDNIKTCDIDSVFWYFEDSLMLARPYDSNYDAVEAGNYILRVKNACGDFYSDTVFLSGNLVAPVVSPAGPICLPVNLSIPTPDTNIVTHWYRKPTSPNCSLSANDLIPDQNEPTLIANLPGYYMAVFVDTITGCQSTCSNFVEVQRSVAGANISPSNDIYFCEGTAINDVTLNVNPASPSFSYQWYRNSSPISGANNSSYTTNMEGVYRVFLENACDNAFTPVVSIFAVENPTIEIDQADTIYLCGPDTMRLDTDIDQPLIYQWYQDDILIVDAVDSFLLATTAGKYQVQGINNNTQCEDWSKEVYILNSTPIVANLQSTAACTGPCSGTLSATVSGGIPFTGGTYQYQWSNGATTAAVNDVCTGLHRLTITDGIGCNTVSMVTVEAGFSLIANVDTIR
ncbi:MAG: SBBP repeat-containing protein, partial [Saprospiraceae bacterium]